MKQFKSIQKSIPDDIALKIVSSLQVSDVCALGCCSRFWRELCGSDFIWEILYKERWPLDEVQQSSSSSANKVWKSAYITMHKEMAGRADTVICLVEQYSSIVDYVRKHGCSSKFLEARDYLKVIEALCAMQLGFKDVQMFLFKPNLNVLLNLVGLHYCIKWLCVPAECLIEVLQSCGISERQLCVKWWELGRRLYGYRLRGVSHSRSVSLGDLARNDEVLRVLHRGAIHEVLRIQICVPNPPTTPWSLQYTKT